jgi:hypothetical protein
MTTTTMPANAATTTLPREICKADVERFLYSKHITACPACGRFRSQCDLDVHAITCQKSCSSSAAPVDVLMVVCQNCGGIQFHDRTVIANWLDCQARGLRG